MKIFLLMKLNIYKWNEKDTSERAFMKTHLPDQSRPWLNLFSDINTGLRSIRLISKRLTQSGKGARLSRVLFIRFVVCFFHPALKSRFICFRVTGPPVQDVFVQKPGPKVDMRVSKTNLCLAFEGTGNGDILNTHLTILIWKYELLGNNMMKNASLSNKKFFSGGLRP